MDMAELLTHPFFLLVVGISVSAGLVPAYTKYVQNRQKILEIRKELILKITKLEAAILSPIQLGFFNDDITIMDEIKEIAKRERENTLNIGFEVKALLKIYYPHTELAKSWEDIFGLWSAAFREMPKDEDKRQIDDIDVDVEINKIEELISQINDIRPKIA